MFECKLEMHSKSPWIMSEKRYAISNKTSHGRLENDLSLGLRLGLSLCKCLEGTDPYHNPSFPKDKDGQQVLRTWSMSCLHSMDGSERGSSDRWHACEAKRAWKIVFRCTCTDDPLCTYIYIYIYIWKDMHTFSQRERDLNV